MLSRIGTVVAAGVGLLLVYRVYMSGNASLAAAVAGGFGLAFFVYTARVGYSARYLFPGLAAIALFIALPLVYTVWIGFTNYGARNLLTFERATQVLLGEVVRSDDIRYEYTLHADPGGFRIVLTTGDEAPHDAADGDAAPDDPAAPGAAPDGDAAGAPAADPAAPTAPAADAPAPAVPADPAAPPAPPPGPFVTPPLALTDPTAQQVLVVPLAGAGVSPGEPLPLKDVIAHREAIRALTVVFPDGRSAAMESLREFTVSVPRYQRNADGTLTDQTTRARLTPNFDTGFYESPSGPVLPGFRTFVGSENYAQIFTDEKFRGPFFRVFAWTVVFAGLSVLLCAGLGLVLAEILSWEGLRFAGAYRVLLFLPYAVPSFISILVFKGLFNSNFGEINLILEALLGIRPDWIGDATLARLMILLVNTWLGYPYFMLIGAGLMRAIPRDLYEASALAGAGPLTNFTKITWPMIRRPLMPLIVSAYAFNFNNFVLIFLLTSGRPDFLDTNVPAGETDLLVSYTYRIAFQDSGQDFGLAAAISTMIFAIVAILSIVNLRLTRATQSGR